MPLHLRNAVTGLMRGTAYGRDYQYAHDYAGGLVTQRHLPDALGGRRYYTLSGNPHERAMVEQLEARHQQNGPSAGGAARHD